MDKFRVGLIGLQESGKIVLAELARNECFHLEAIADEDFELAKELAADHEVRPYDDRRSLIVQEKLDIIFLTLPTYRCGECVTQAVKTGSHIFKSNSLARTMPEAAEWLKQMDKAGLRFEVGVELRFAPGYLEGHRLLAEEKIGNIYMVRAESLTSYPEQMGWRGDPVMAGGGALIDIGYGLIDQINWNMNPPERVYAQHVGMCSKKKLPPYRTEDTATMTLTFPSGAIGQLLCGWTDGQHSERIAYYGTEGMLETFRDAIRLWDNEGNLLRAEVYPEVNQQWLIAQQIRHFADSLLDNEILPASTPRQHLATVATIEAAYLSSRTQGPETLAVYGQLFDIE